MDQENPKKYLNLYKEIFFYHFMKNWIISIYFTESET